ncbi:type I restriction enzyme, S subunit/type I restriction enzyme M protein [Maribacter dokdonensis]|uniref:Type I restriction enzyme, S subunit/type I restriction enzyme M protein n=1 Tax=Maribacter dokdonensis TaxID=320912 RepID=A0ABY0UF47_9FLAO|nr:restriction endonuclease subunit S [Maribacter dokdonensis]SDS57871.1 type I restriction enzyme, S subunit/type I restriction enzyme M protein [Maribacter dokdonensis]
MSDILENTIEELRLDKSKWKLTKFGDVAIQQKGKIDRDNTTLTRYIKGEHMGSEDLHIRKWGDLTDEYLGPAFIRKFEKGDILYGSRRTYLRKVGIADFDGITSNTTLVIKANEEKIDKRLLPFIMMSEGFTENSIKNSKGSVNPYINWKDIAKYEFLLPPKDQQAQLAKLLWAMDEVVERENETLNKLKDAYYTSINQFMIHGNYGSGGEIIKTKCGLLDKRIDVIKLKDCLLEKPTYGANASSKPFEDGSLRYIRITDIDDEGNLIKEDKVTIDSKDYSQYLLRNQDFLFARTGNTVGKTLLYDSKMENSVFAGYLIRFRVNPKKLNPKFLFYFTKSLKYETFKRKMIKVGAQPNINSEEYQSMILPNFAIQIQQELIDKLDFMKSNIDSLKSKISSSKALQKSLINQVF